MKYHNKHLIEFPVGDWSDDGHGKCAYYIIESAKPVQEVREVHFRAPKVCGFNIGDICCEYGEGSLNDYIRCKLEELGFAFQVIEEIEHLTSRDIVNIWVFLLNHVDGSLELSVLDIPSINFYGYDEKKRHLNTPGYGVMMG